MKDRSLGRALDALIILIPGGVGALVVARTLAAYLGRDGLASLMVVSIGVALAIGLVELSARLLRVAALERELRALPVAASEGAIESASPQLSAMLRARLEHVPLPNFGEGIAPFLTGLLVMLGLLGTLLGLFQTVRGAGHALSNSADIEALRSGLSAPLDGLTRSFGCSAAGISGSAMLGLALALVRRRESRVMRIFHAYATGPLRALSPVQRQLKALERMAGGQRSSLPESAHAIESLGDKLSELSNQLVSLQKTAINAQQRAFSDLLGSLRGEFVKAAGETGEALHGHVSPLLEQMASRSGEALMAQAGALTEVAREVTRSVERDAATRREEALHEMEALRARFDESERVRSTAQAEQLQALTQLATGQLGEAERREAALAERWKELTSRFDRQLDAARSSEVERLRSLDLQLISTRDLELQRWKELHEQLDAQREAARSSETERLRALDDQAKAEAERWQQLVGRMDALLATAGATRVRGDLDEARDDAGERARESERAGDARGEVGERAAELGVARESELTTRVSSELERLTAALNAQIEQRGSSERALDERAQRALERQVASEQQIHGLARNLEEALSAARERDAELTTRVGAELERLSGALSAQLEQRSVAERALDERAQQALERRLSSEQQLQERIENTLEQRFAKEQELQERAERGLQERLTREREVAEQAERALQERLARESEVAEQAANAVQQRLASEREMAEQAAIGLQQRLAAERELSELAARAQEQRLAAERELSELAARAQEQRLAAERTQEERAERVLQQLAQTAAATESGMARQEAALERFVEQLVPTVQSELRQLVGSIQDQHAGLSSAVSAQLGRLADATGQQHTETSTLVSTRLAELIEATRERHAEVVGSFSAQLEELRALDQQRSSQLSTTLAGELTQLTASVQERLSQVSGLLSAELMQRSSAGRVFEERNEAVLARLEQGSELLDSSIARQSTGMSELFERMGALLPQLADAAQAGAVQTIAQLRESAEQHAAHFAELEASLERGREQHMAGLGDQLASHAAELEQRLTRTSDVVQEAAAIWQASSAEMQAVAELFARSAERQREASDAWLESLGTVEGAVERAGREAARDALSDQLASTQELFARQLQFQRELFEQLRALRAGAPRVSNGERDVSY